MTKFHKQHKLYTYTDVNLMTETPDEILVYVYAYADLSKEIEELRHYPRSEVTPYPIKIEVKFPITIFYETAENILASAEAIAQVAAVSPDFFNIFGTKKGVNITDLLLVASQPILTKFAQFDKDTKEDVSRFCLQNLTLSSVYFYGAATRDLLDNEHDWVAPLLSGKEAPYAIYNTSPKGIFNSFCIENNNEKFFVTRLAIEDYLSLPHRFISVEEVTRPFKAVRGVFAMTFKEPIAGSPYAVDEDDQITENNRKKKVLLAPGIWRLRLNLIEEEIFGESVYIVRGMPPYMSREDLQPYFDAGTDHFENSKKIRDYLKEKQRLAVALELG